MKSKGKFFSIILALVMTLTLLPIVSAADVNEKELIDKGIAKIAELSGFPFGIIESNNPAGPRWGGIDITINVNDSRVTAAEGAFSIQLPVDSIDWNVDLGTGNYLYEAFAIVDNDIEDLTNDVTKSGDDLIAVISDKFGDESLRIIYIAIPQYTVTFNLNGGTGTIPTQLTGKGGRLATLPTPTPPANKAFAGWITGTGASVTPEYMFLGNTTVIANYIDISNFAFFKAISDLSGYAITDIQKAEILMGNSLKVELAIKMGMIVNIYDAFLTISFPIGLSREAFEKVDDFYFFSFGTDEALTKVVDVEGIEVDEDARATLTLTGELPAIVHFGGLPVHTIIFDAGDGNLVGTAPKALTGFGGRVSEPLAALPVAEKDNAEFLGWYTAPQGENGLRITVTEFNQIQHFPDAITYYAWFDDEVPETGLADMTGYIAMTVVFVVMAAGLWGYVINRKLKREQ